MWGSNQGSKKPLKPTCAPGQGEPPSSRGHSQGPGALSSRALRGWRFVRDRGASSRWMALVIQQQGRTDGLWEAIHLTDEEIEGRLGHGGGRPLARDGTGLSGDEPVNAPSPADPARWPPSGRWTARGQQRPPHSEDTDAHSAPGPRVMACCCTNVTGTLRLSGSVAPQVGCFAWDSPGTVGRQDLGDPSVVAVPLTLWKPSASPSRVLPPVGGCGSNPWGGCQRSPVARRAGARAVRQSSGKAPLWPHATHHCESQSLSLVGGGSGSRPVVGAGKKPRRRRALPEAHPPPPSMGRAVHGPRTRSDLGELRPPCQGSWGGRALGRLRAPPNAPRL